MNELKLAILESDLNKLNLLLSQKQLAKLVNSEIKELIKLSIIKEGMKIQTTLLLKYKTELNSYSVKEKERLIISLLEELSEDIYCSGWNDGIERDIWNWGNGITQPNKLFENRVILSDSKLAINFGKEIGLWAEWNTNQNEPKAITLENWIKKMAE
jgi:hypothetical protein